MVIIIIIAALLLAAYPVEANNNNLPESEIYVYPSVINCNYDFPTADNSDIVITFRSDLGTAGLKDYTGDIYAHTGVITSQSTSSSDWKYEIADWSENLDKAKLTKIADNTYSLTIGSIADFYGISQDIAKTVTQLAFVFRSADGTKEGKGDVSADILINIYQPSLVLKINSPSQQPYFADINQEISFDVAVSDQQAEITFACDNTDYGFYSSTNNTISFSESGLHQVTFTAKTTAETTSQSFQIFVRQSGSWPEAPMPANYKCGVNIINNSSVALVLYAPQKTSAFAIGDFNNWTLTQMSKSGDYFFAEISNLDPDKEYAYQFLLDETIRIADPYTQKILDPVNDKYITDIIYPSLTAYPTGKTTDIVSTFKINKTAFNFDDFNIPDPDKAVIYELLIRDFTSEGTIKAALDSLDYLQNLGINTIELMPFSEFEGNDSWGYNPSFYFAADKAYGTADDYKNFINECHKRGIAVVQDLVLNHSFSQSPFVKLYYNSTTNKVTSSNPWYNVDSPNKLFSWGYDFNHESAATQTLVDSIVNYWLTEYNVDGFRFDFTKGFTNTIGDGWAYDASRIAILKRIKDKIEKVKPGAYMICEHLTDNSEEKELAAYGIMLWGNINYAFCQSAMGYAQDCDISNVYYVNRGFKSPMLVSYAESHDEERVGYKVSQCGAKSTTTDYDSKSEWNFAQRASCVGVSLLSVPGPKMIWQFGEIGYDYSIDYNERVGKKPLTPDYFGILSRKSIYLSYAMINKLNKEESIFAQGNFEMSGSELLKTFYRTSESGNAIIVCNFSVEEKNSAINFAHTGTWYDIVNNKEYDITGLSTSMTFAPGTYTIFCDKKIAVETDVETIEYQPENAQIEVFPNPCTDFINIKYLNDQRISRLAVVNAAGVIVYHQDVNQQSDLLKINTSNLKSGIYLIVAQIGNDVVSKKIIINR